MENVTNNRELLFTDIKLINHISTILREYVHDKEHIEPLFRLEGYEHLRTGDGLAIKIYEFQQDKLYTIVERSGKLTLLTFALSGKPRDLGDIDQYGDDGRKKMSN